MQSATTLSGSVIGIGGSDIVMLGSDGTSTIRLNEGTILTKDGNRADPDDLVPGATIKAFGTFNPQERVLEADRVTSVTSTVPTQPEPKKSTGLLQNISAWLSVRGGALSMRRATKKRV